LTLSDLEQANLLNVFLMHLTNQSLLTWADNCNAATILEFSKPIIIYNN